MSPFFALGHLEAYYWQVPRDDFSYTYLFWMVTGCVFYIVLALFLLRHILLQYFDDVAVATTLLIIGIGTNLLFYSVYEFLMSHAHSFFLFSLALFLATEWLKNQRAFIFLALSLVAGLIAVTRLPNMLFFIVLAFWGVHTKEGLWERLLLYQKHWRLIIGGILFVIPFIPQMMYWYLSTGHFILNTYGSGGEHFNWGTPMIAEILIGYRKGWLVYTPAMIFGFLGFYILFKEQKDLFWSVFIYILINIYVISCWWCWWCWWYGGSFGMRALVECSVAMSIPIAAFIQYLISSSFVSHMLSIVIAGFISLNMFQIYQYHHRIIHWANMTKESYWSVFGVVHPAHPPCIEKRDKHLLKGN